MKNRRGFGFIYPRGGVWWIGYSFRGKRYRETTEILQKDDPKQTQAGKLLMKRLGEIGKGRLISPDAQRVTFEDLAALIEQDYRANRRKSIKRMLRSVKELRVYFGQDKAVEIPARAAGYIKLRSEQGLEPASIRLELTALKRMFTLAWQARLLAERPYIPSLQVRNTRQGFFEDDQIKAVMKHLPEHLKPVFAFALATGWRKEEILKLEWRQIDLKAQTIRLEPDTTKNDEGRTIPYKRYPTLANIITAQHEHTKALEHATAKIIPWVFHRKGRQIRDHYAAWRKARIAAGCPDRILHDCRRTAVRSMERAGVPRSQAMKITGHLTESVYKRYAIVNEEDLSEAGAKLERATQERAQANEA